MTTFHFPFTKGKYTILVQEKINNCAQLFSLLHENFHLLLGDQPCWCTSHWQAVPSTLARWNGETLIASRRRGDSSLATVMGDAGQYHWGCAWDIYSVQVPGMNMSIFMLVYVLWSLIALLICTYTQYKLCIHFNHLIRQMGV